MEEQQVQSIREQVFGHSPTHAPTPTNVVPTAETEVVIDTPPADIPPADTPPVDTPPPFSVDENTWKAAQSELEELRQFKANPTKEELKFENEQSKAIAIALQEGKFDEVYSILNTQKRLSDAESMSAADVLKLHIEQTNKHYKAADVQDVFEERYSLPEKPIQGDNEEDDDYNNRVSVWQNAADKVTRKIERDAVTAKEELAKLKTEIKVQYTPAATPELEDLNAYKANLAAAEQEKQKLVESLSKVSEQNVAIKIPFNDEAKKVNFEATFQSDKEGVDKAKNAALNYVDFLSENYYTEDGSPLADKLTADIYFLQNRDKIITEMINQAVNETLLQTVRNQKNIGDGIHRNFTQVQPSEVEKLREQVFSRS